MTLTRRPTAEKITVTSSNDRGNHSGHLTATPDGTWRVAPSRFIGYASNNAAAYLRGQHDRDGRRTERALSAWSDTAEPGSAAYEDITAAVLRVFARYGRAPNKRLRVSALKPERAPAQARGAGTTERSLFRSRITLDAGDDISAALEYAAMAADHRVVTVA